MRKDPKKIIDELLACNADDQCESREGLAERYYFVPQHLIDEIIRVLENE